MSFGFVGREGGLFFQLCLEKRFETENEYVLFCQFTSLPLFLFSHYTRQHHARTDWIFDIYYLHAGYVLECNGMEWNGMDKKYDIGGAFQLLWPQDNLGRCVGFLICPFRFQ